MPLATLGRFGLGVLVGIVVALPVIVLLWAQLYEENGGRITAGNWVFAMIPAFVMAAGVSRTDLRSLCLGGLVGFVPCLILFAIWV